MQKVLISLHVLKSYIYSIYNTRFPYISFKTSYNYIFITLSGVKRPLKSNSNTKGL